MVHLYRDSYISMADKFWQEKAREIFYQKASHKKSLEQLKLDLPRTCFVDLTGKRHADFKAACLEQVAQFDEFSFCQGDLDAGNFALCLLLQALSSAHLNAIGSSDRPDKPIILPKSQNEDDKKEESMALVDSIRFAYYDDTGTLCGFCLGKSALDSSRWIMAVTRKPLAQPEDREVTVLTHSMKSSVKGRTLLPFEVKDQISNALRSSDISSLISPLFGFTGNIDVARFDRLGERINPSEDLFSSKEIKRLRKRQQIGTYIEEISNGLAALVLAGIGTAFLAGGIFATIGVCFLIIGGLLATLSLVSAGLKFYQAQKERAKILQGTYQGILESLSDEVTLSPASKADRKTPLEKSVVADPSPRKTEDRAPDLRFYSSSTSSPTSSDDAPGLNLHRSLGSTGQ